MSTNKHWAGVALSCLAAVAAPAVAVSPQQGGIRAMSGGIGDADQRMMRNAASQYGLALTFASYAGDYLAGVDVQVTDQSGAVVYSGNDTGPMLLLDLPQGQYTVQATFEGHTLRHAVTVGESDSRGVTLNWRVPETGPGRMPVRGSGT